MSWKFYMYFGNLHRDHSRAATEIFKLRPVYHKKDILPNKIVMGMLLNNITFSTVHSFPVNAFTKVEMIWNLHK